MSRSLMFYLGPILLLAGAVWSFLKWRAERTCGFVLTPYLAFMGQEVVLVWIAAIQSYWTGNYRDGYPVIVCALGFLAFLAAFSTCKRYEARPRVFAASPSRAVQAENRYWMGLLVGTVLLLLLGLYLYRGLPPLITIMRETGSGSLSAGELANYSHESRFLLTKSHWFGGQYRGVTMVRVLLRFAWPYLVAIALSLAFLTRRRRWFLAAGALFLLAFVFVAGDGSRAPFILVHLAVVVALSLQRPLGLRGLLLVGVVTFALLVGMSMLSSKGITASVAESRTPVEENRTSVAESRTPVEENRTPVEENRIQQVAASVLARLPLNGENNVVIIEFTRSGALVPHMGRIHLDKFLSALPGVQIGTPFSYELWKLKHPYSEGTTFASSTYLGTLYADFGLAGVLAGYALMGLMIGASYRLLYGQQKGPIAVARAAVWTVALANMTLSGPIEFCSDTAAILAFDWVFVAVVARSISSPLAPRALARLRHALNRRAIVTTISRVRRAVRPGGT